MDILIRRAQVFDGEKLTKKDVLLQDGVVADMGDGLESGGARVIPAEGCVLSPGFTDLHVHLRQPGYEEKETMASGTRAAAAGGFTTVCAMPNLSPVPDGLQGLDPQQKLIQKDATVRVLPYGAITVGEKGARLSDIEALAPFVVGFTDDGFGVQDEEVMAQAMQRVAAEGGLVAAHCEVEALLPKNGVCVQENSSFAQKLGLVGYSAESEWREVERDIRLCEKTGCRLHICHASTKESFQLVREAKQRGLPVSCEATPHNLLLSCDDIGEDNGRFKMNPPLRTSADVQAAREALADGTIDAIATDHAPHTKKQKDAPFAESLNGVVGLETCFAAMHTGFVKSGSIGLEKVLSLLTNEPRKVIGETQEAIQKGQRANLVLLDLELEKVVEPESFQSMGKSSPFAGEKLAGWPILTIYDGRIVWDAVK